MALRSMRETRFTQCPRVLGALLLIASARVEAADLRKETVAAFDHYVADVEARLERRWHGDGFLWSDNPARRDLLARGGPIVEPVEGNGNIEIKGGLIQDWTGAIFIPSANLASVLAVAQDYPHHSEIYKPEIASALVRSHTGNDFAVYMRIVKSKLFLSDVLNTEHEIHFVPVDAKREYSRGYSTRIAEVSNPGKPNLQFSAHPLGLLHDAQSILSENLSNVAVRIAFAQQRLGDFRQFGAIFHAVRHVRAIKIGTQADMLGANQFYGVIDVVDDSFPTDVRQFSLRHQLLLLAWPSRARCKPHRYCSSW
jgi:hypothetical protein